jgi:hypothetical protein
MSFARLQNPAQSSFASLPASSLSALAGFGCMSRHDIVTSTSRSLSVLLQSRFSVSTQTAPEASSTLGCQHLVRKKAVGADVGYVAGISRCRRQTPFAYGVPTGPESRTSRDVRSAEESVSGGNR